MQNKRLLENRTSGQHPVVIGEILHAVRNRRFCQEERNSSHCQTQDSEQPPDIGLLSTSWVENMIHVAQSASEWSTLPGLGIVDGRVRDINQLAHSNASPDMITRPRRLIDRPLV